MAPEVLRAKAETLRQWAREGRQEAGEGWAEIAYQCDRVARLLDGVATNMPFTAEAPVPAKEPSVDEVRPG